MAYLEMRSAVEGRTIEASSFGDTIVVRPGASKATVLEEFLHTTQSKLGLIVKGRFYNPAEGDLMNWMERHRDLLGLKPQMVTPQ
ncbi:MAG TPA: hypothetical protein VE377_14040 [Candidatus Dormibacteraeota bacterium]|nr:hypothetical protein [Candidatus Dormibacteraeota bacterium]